MCVSYVKQVDHRNGPWYLNELNVLTHQEVNQYDGHEEEEKEEQQVGIPFEVSAARSWQEHVGIIDLAQRHHRYSHPRAPEVVEHGLQGLVVVSTDHGISKY